jgi:hypothetical protein
MTGDEIRQLAGKYGQQAAKKFIEKFVDKGAKGWREHRWVRFNTLIVAVRERVRVLREAVELDHHAVPLADQITSALSKAPLRGPERERPADPLSPEQVDLLRAELKALLDLAKELDRIHGKPSYTASPRPSLRIRHPT